MRGPLSGRERFCGLGNPESFRRTLEECAAAPVDWVQFPDHHRYGEADLRRAARRFAAQGATAIVTTEKDAMNLRHEIRGKADLPVFWLEIALKIECEEELLLEAERQMRLARPDVAC